MGESVPPPAAPGSCFQGSRERSFTFLPFIHIPPPWHDLDSIIYARLRGYRSLDPLSCTSVIFLFQNLHSQNPHLPFQPDITMQGPCTDLTLSGDQFAFDHRSGFPAIKKWSRPQEDMIVFPFGTSFPRPLQHSKSKVAYGNFI